MNGIGIHGEHSEPNIVRSGYRTAQSMTINISDREIFEVSALPTFFNCHNDLFVLSNVRF
jgi:hypothetical protein